MVRRANPAKGVTRDQDKETGERLVFNGLRKRRPHLVVVADKGLPRVCRKQDPVPELPQHDHNGVVRVTVGGCRHEALLAGISGSRLPRPWEEEAPPELLLFLGETVIWMGTAPPRVGAGQHDLNTHREKITDVLSHAPEAHAAGRVVHDGKGLHSVDQNVPSGRRTGRRGIIGEKMDCAAYFRNGSSSIRAFINNACAVCIFDLWQLQ